MLHYKVSILISSYNYAHIIEDTFESIKNQTFDFDDIEVIFVDDHSEDNSVHVLLSPVPNLSGPGCVRCAGAYRMTIVTPIGAYSTSAVTGSPLTVSLKTVETGMTE